MEPETIAAIILVVIFVLLTIGLITVFALHLIPVSVDQQSAEITALLDSVSLQKGFSAEQIPIDGLRGECNLYTTFSTNTLAVDNIVPFALLDDVPPEFQCNDGYSLPLIKLSSECEQELCRGINGLDYTQGESQIYYQICAQLEPCQNGRSAVILNFERTNTGHLETTSRCIASNGQIFSSSNCPEFSTLQTNSFLNVDTKPIPFTQDYLQVRIRAPGTNNCLVGLSSQPCLSRTDQGFSWVLTTANPTDVELGELYYPPRLLVSPDPIPTDPDQLNAYLRSNNGQLVSQGSNLALVNYRTCVSGQVCEGPTQLISGFQYQQLV